MAGWSEDELEEIGTTEEIQIAPLDADGTPRNPTTIWIVRVGDALFVRSWRGKSGAWYTAARASRAGRIRSGGIEKEVSFKDVSDAELNDQIDAAYGAKYGQYPQYVKQMVASEQRETTLKVIPRDEGPSG